MGAEAKSGREEESETEADTKEERAEGETASDVGGGEGVSGVALSNEVGRMESNLTASVDVTLASALPA